MVPVTPPPSPLVFGVQKSLVGIRLIWFIFFDGKNNLGLGRIWSFVLGLRSLVARFAPFERVGRKSAIFLATESVKSLEISAQQWWPFKAGPPLDLSFWSFLTFLHHGIEEVERHLLWKFYTSKTIRRKSWSNVPPKLLACIGFLYKVVHKIGRLRKFNHSHEIEIEFNFLTAWTISMKFGTLVEHAPGYKTLPQIF